MKKRFGFSIFGAILVGLAAFFAGLRMNVRPENQKPAKHFGFVRGRADI